jgi:hypothetical protein
MVYLLFPLLAFAANDYSGCADPADLVKNQNKNPTAYGITKDGWLKAAGTEIRRDDSPGGGQLIRGTMDEGGGPEMATTFLLERDKLGRPAGVAVSWPTAGPKGERSVIHRDFAFEGGRCYIAQEWSELVNGQNAQKKTVDYDYELCRDLKIAEACKVGDCEKKAADAWAKNRSRIEAVQHHKDGTEYEKSLVQYWWTPARTSMENATNLAQHCRSVEGKRFIPQVAGKKEKAGSSWETTVTEEGKSAE